MEMVEVILTKKERPILAIEDYLDFAGGQTNLEDLTFYRLREILSMHGLKKMKGPKKDVMEVVNKMEPMKIDRSTLQDDAVSPGVCLTLKEVIKDLKRLDWNECHITSLRTLNAAASNGAVPVKKQRKARAAASTTTTATSSSGDKNDTVSPKKRKKAPVAVPVSTTQAVSSAGNKVSVSVKKKKKAGIASVTTTGTTSVAGKIAAVAGVAASGTSVAAGGTTKRASAKTKLLHEL